MKFITENHGEEYLHNSEIIDFENSNIKQISTILSNNIYTDVDLVKKVFIFVRDKIKHSADIAESIITGTASEVLKSGHGLCFAKAHLLAAILRSLGIPTGFCYQGILINAKMPHIVLHGLNAVYLESIGKWIRIDARGNSLNILAEFSITEEKLAYKIRNNLGEFDSPIIYAKPNNNLIDTLRKFTTLNDLLLNLPNKLA